MRNKLIMLMTMLACSPALAGMPPKEYDHTYAGTIEKHCSVRCRHRPGHD